MIRTLALLIVALCLTATSKAGAQDTATVTRTIGLATSLQNEQLDLIAPIWVSQRVVIAPALGIVYGESLGIDVQLGVMARYYFNNGVIAPYIGPKIGVMIFNPENGSGDIDGLAGIMLGGEYYLHPQFSVGLEGQLNVIISGDNSTRFGNPGKMNINTGSAVFATFYF
jgi:hypothetical protein